MKQRRNTAPLLYIVLSALMIGSFFYLRQVEIDVARHYQSADLTHKAIYSIDISDTPLYITDMSLFTDDNIWSYVSRNAPLPEDFEPAGLVDVPVDHSADDPSMKVAADIKQPLENLFAQAEKDGLNLIIASAYRSIDEQRELYSDFSDRLGTSQAALYVAQPRSSEHHGGLSVDIDDYSADCHLDSFACNLSPSSAAWLAANAPEFGFILRYPDGAYPITGIAAEPWHFRYVGKPLAKRLTAADLTFDEFIQQVAPGRIDSK